MPFDTNNAWLWLLKGFDGLLGMLEQLHLKGEMPNDEVKKQLAVLHVRISHLYKQVCKD
jgi:hypothetical protein